HVAAMRFHGSELRSESSSPRRGEGWGEGAHTFESNVDGRTPCPYPLPAGERALGRCPRARTRSFAPFAAFHPEADKAETPPSRAPALRAQLWQLPRVRP